MHERGINDDRITIVFAIYDNSTGEILHFHHFVVMPGAQAPGEREAQDYALRVATRISNRSISNLSTIPINPPDLRPGFHYSVDVAQNELVCRPLRSDNQRVG
jgi:hypothetical protein